VRSVHCSGGSSIEQGDNGVTLMTTGSREDLRHCPWHDLAIVGNMQVFGRLNLVFKRLCGLFGLW
jgi:hypothetical protein